MTNLYDLPREVRRFHENNGRFSGRVSITTRRFARWFGLPSRSGEFDIHVDIERVGDAEIWTRHFPPRPMRSRLRAEGGTLVERLGPATLRFTLHGDATGLEWKCIGVRILGIAFPPHWFRVIAHESSDDGLYRFVAGASLPLLGELVRYEGWLDVG